MSKRRHIFYTLIGCIKVKVSKGAEIRNQYNQVQHLTQDTNGKVTNSYLYTTNESAEVSPFPAGDSLFKKDELSSVSNYRHISILNRIGKVMEK